MTVGLLLKLVAIQVTSAFVLPQYEPYYRPQMFQKFHSDRSNNGYYIPTVENVNQQYVPQRKYFVNSGNPFERHQLYRNSHRDLYEPKRAPSDASYTFNIDTDSYKRMETADARGNVVGSYSYTNENGTHDLSYVAGAGVGFQPIGGSLATLLRGTADDTVQIRKSNPAYLGGVKMRYQPHDYFRIVTPTDPNEFAPFYVPNHPSYVYYPPATPVQPFYPPNNYPNQGNPFPGFINVVANDPHIPTTPPTTPTSSGLPPAQQTLYPDNESIVVDADPEFRSNEQSFKSPLHPSPSPRLI